MNGMFEKNPRVISRPQTAAPHQNPKPNHSPQRSTANPQKLEGTQNSTFTDTKAKFREYDQE